MFLVDLCSPGTRPSAEMSQYSGLVFTMLTFGPRQSSWKPGTGEARGEVMRKCLENSGRVRAIMVDLFPPGFFTSVDAGSVKP